MTQLHVCVQCPIMAVMLVYFQCIILTETWKRSWQLIAARAVKLRRHVSEARIANLTYRTQDIARMYSTQDIARMYSTQDIANIRPSNERVNSCTSVKGLNASLFNIIIISQMQNWNPWIKTMKLYLERGNIFINLTRNKSFYTISEKLVMYQTAFWDLFGWGAVGSILAKLK